MFGKKINNLIPGIVLKSLLYLIGFFNEIGYLRLNNIAHFILLAHAMEDFQLALFRLLVLPYCADESAHIADIISESYAAESLYEYQYDGFVLVGRCDVAEPHRQHDVSAPVIPPDIFYIPRRMQNTQLDVPVNLGIQTTHQIQENREKMADDEICKENFK